MIRTFFKLTLNIKFGDIVRSLGPFTLENTDDKAIDNLDDAKIMAERVCQSHLMYHGGDTIEYIIDKHTVEEVSKGTIPH